MQNYRFRLEYDGTRYNGWQRLKENDNTIQFKLEAVLTRMTGTPVQVIGAGRTDAGVHALGQVANAHLETGMSAKEIMAYVNHYLPEDIRVLFVDRVHERFHSRFNAIEKQYVYRIDTGAKSSVFERKYLYLPEQRLDVGAMRRAAAELVGTHDFTSFCGNRHMKKSAVRTVYGIEISEKKTGPAGDDLLEIRYRGDGFLQYMIRIMTGTLIEVGSGRRDPESMQDLLNAKDRAKAGYTVPPCGLFLENVLFREPCSETVN